MFLTLAAFQRQLLHGLRMLSFKLLISLLKVLEKFEILCFFVFLRLH